MFYKCYIYCYINTIWWGQKGDENPFTNTQPGGKSHLFGGIDF